MKKGAIFGTALAHASVEMCACERGRECQMKHVTLFVMSSWAVHSFSTPRIKHFLSAFFPDKWITSQQGSLSRIFTLFTKAAKKRKRKRLEIQFGTTRGAYKARPPQKTPLTKNVFLLFPIMSRDDIGRHADAKASLAANPAEYL